MNLENGNLNNSLVEDLHNVKNELYDFEFLSEEELSELDENQRFEYDKKLRKISEKLYEEHYIDTPDISIFDSGKKENDKDNPREEYFGRFIDYKNKTLKINKPPTKTQEEKDRARIEAIKRVIAKRNANNRIGIIDPLDPTL